MQVKQQKSSGKVCSEIFLTILSIYISATALATKDKKMLKHSILNQSLYLPSNTLL